MYKTSKKVLKLKTEANSLRCTNCGAIHVYKKKPAKPASNTIAGYCKSCGHVVWYD